MLKVTSSHWKHKDDFNGSASSNLMNLMFSPEICSIVSFISNEAYCKYKKTQQFLFPVGVFALNSKDAGKIWKRFGKNQKLSLTFINVKISNSMQTRYRNVKCLKIPKFSNVLLRNFSHKLGVYPA